MRNKRSKIRRLIRNMIREEKYKYDEPSLHKSGMGEDAPLGKNTIIIKLDSGKKLAIDKESFIRLKKGKDVVGNNLKTGEENWILAKTDKYSVVDEDAPYGKPDASKYWSVNDGKDYKEFFKSALQKFRVASPEELPEEKKKEFFDYVDANWKSAQEFDDLEEMSSVGAMGGSDGYQTPNAFSAPGTDPKKKRALKNNSWTIVENKIKNANKKYKRRK